METAPDLETLLLNQLESLSAALEPSASPTPERQRPIRSTYAPKSSSPRPALPPATALKMPEGETPGRSVFAPDPVRQRHYVDLRTPSDHRGAAETKKAVAAKPSPVAASRGAVDRLPQANEVLWDDDPAGFEPPPPNAGSDRASLESGVTGRGLDARTLSIAALIGVGLGFGGLTLMSYLTPQSEPSSVLASSIVPLDRIVTNAGQAIPPAVAPGGTPSKVVSAKDQERLPAEVGPSDPVEVEGKTRSMTVEAPQVAAPIVVKTEAPPESPVSRPGSTATRLTTAGDIGFGSPWVSQDLEQRPNVLAYAPVRERDDAATVASPETGPAQNRGPGVAKVNLDVNVRSAPDNDAPVVLVAKSGTSLKIEKCLFWCTVEVDGQRGYIYRKFVGR